MKLYLLTLSLICSSVFSMAQERIDRTQDFQTETGKKYSIYVPSSYVEGTENKLMVALHPWNTSRWNAKSWCDTLVDFAEKNGLLVLCTDGGSDGKVDDAIDTAFTSALLDSMHTWYTVNPEKTFLMGFSWGGRTTYTYGLNRYQTFAGFMPIGAAISLGDVPNNIRSNAANLPWYLIHGSMDAPSTRYTAMLGMLDDNNAITESNYLSGVGHTIDFPNRNKILTEGFEWLDSVSSLNTSTAQIIDKEASLRISYQGSSQSLLVQNVQASGKLQLSLFDLSGKLHWEGQISLDNASSRLVQLPKLSKGVYTVSAVQGGRQQSYKVVVR